MSVFKKFINSIGLSAVLMLSTSSLIYAAPITSTLSNGDISSITATTPSGWTAHNLDLLFDGETSRYTNTRYAGYQNSGDVLSDSNVFNINVLLNKDVNISSISFYNDWRNILGQQVEALTVSLSNNNSQLLWSGSFSSLMQHTWSKIDLVSFNVPVVDVREIDIDVTRSQGNHFEIRELIINTIELPELAQNKVNSPASIALLLVSLIGLLVFRRKN